MKAIGYIRVSTEDQAQEGVSLANQESKILSYASLNDLDLVEVLRDEGKSAKTLQREGMLNLLDMVKAKEIEAVIVYKLDRLSRRTIDVLNLIELFEAQGVAFHSINEKVDTKTAMGRFFLTIIGALSQMERDLISERTISALGYKKSQGEKCGGSLPYGFCGVESGKLISDPVEMETVGRIIELRDKGLSFRKVSDKLKAEGIKSRTENGFHPQQIKRICQFHCHTSCEA